MVGTREAIDACRRHPLARAVRIDKLSLAALEATLALYRDPERALREIPVLRMLLDGPERRARERLAERDRRRDRRGDGEGRRRRAAAARAARAGRRARRRRRALAARLRGGDPPVIGRIAGRPAAARPADARRRRGRARRRRAARVSAPRSRSAPPGTSTTARPRSSGALTGVDTDRLPQERERGISIELGYAPLDLPSGRRLSRRRRARATSGSCARWSRARPGSTCSSWSSRPTTA